MSWKFQAALVAALVTPLFAAQAGNINATYSGTLVVSNVTGPCSTLPGVVKGAKLPAVLRVPLGPDNPPAGLLVTLENGAFIGFPQNIIVTGPYQGIVLTPFATFGKYTGGAYDVTVSPLPVTPNTQKVTITGKITKFAGVAGCTVTSKTIVNAD